MIVERSTNVLQLPGAGVLAGLEALIDARIDARLKALNVGNATARPAWMSTRADLRRAAGYLSQLDLEVAAQLPRGTLSQYESGHIRNPGSRNRAPLERVCALLHVTIAEYCQAKGTNHA